MYDCIQIMHQYVFITYCCRRYIELLPSLYHFKLKHFHPNLGEGLLAAGASVMWPWTVRVTRGWLGRGATHWFCLAGTRIHGHQSSPFKMYDKYPWFHVVRHKFHQLGGKDSAKVFKETPRPARQWPFERLNQHHRFYKFHQILASLFRLTKIFECISLPETNELPLTTWWLEVGRLIHFFLERLKLACAMLVLGSVISKTLQKWLISKGLKITIAGWGLDDFVEAATSFWLDTGVREQVPFAEVASVFFCSS